MGYKRAGEVLPKELIAEIQKYVDGQLLYIPRKSQEHYPWGSNTGTRRTLQDRNRQIAEAYGSGQSVTELSEAYFLSEKSIRRILRSVRSSGET